MRHALKCEWVRECECIQLCKWLKEQLETLEMVREWTHSLHMAKTSAATSTGGFAGAFITYPCIILEKFSETPKPHCCFRNSMFPHHGEVILRIPLCTYHQSSSITAMFFQKGPEGLYYCVHTETILNDFTERFGGGRFSQVNKIQNELVFFQNHIIRLFWSF